MACFHNKCGKRVTLLNNNCTAVRSICEFNHGIVLSAEPLINDSLFEVKIDKKVNAWSGNIEIGVIASHPESIDLPACALALRNGSWIMSGNSVLKDGQPVTECYGEDLDKLSEGDRIGVMRTSHGELVIFINGTPQGIAAEGLPSTVYAVVDMYGKCVQVSMVTSIPLEHDNEENMNCSYSQLTLEQELMSGLQSSLQSNLSELSLDIQQDWNVSLNIPLESNETASNVTRPVDTIQRDRLHFHSRCGTFVKLTSNFRTAERRRPLDEFNNGVVMTHRPLIDDELFEIRIDRLVDKWSGSIEVGVTTHNPNLLEFPATMTNMRSGTIMMSGCGILTNGKGTRREYGEFNLDELREGDRVGMMRKSNGNLHYFINGMDQGIAASKVAQSVWGVIDLYGMTIKVTIVDRDEREEQNLITRRNTLLQDMSLNIHELSCDFDCHDRLTFHTNCGTHADVINNGRTAHRPNAMDDFNNGVVLTARPLKPNEQFEVRLDKVVTKWAGSIEIGVTTHLPTELEFPFTMTNVRSGTWMMTGNGVMHNGTTIIDHYGMNLDRLQVGDRVAVIRKDTGTIHFFVNGVDQGPAATNIPERVYGVIDLYGQAAQVTIQDSLDCYSPETINSSISNTTLYTDLRFHHLHGKNARISNNGMTASRTRAFAEFNDAIVFSNRQLRDDEIFEIVLDKMVDRWSGSIELGVTSMRPDEIDLPSTATDLDQYTWMLSGAVVMENGITLKNGYNCDLDTLAVDTKIGVSRKTNGMLHFYRDGIDQGPACRVPRTGVYAVIDLYGQCAQVSLAGARCTTATGVPSSPPQSEEPTPASLQASIIQQPLCGQNQIPATDSYLAHRFSEWHGKNITLAENNTNASRNRNSSYCLVFSSNSLTTDELFEVGILSVAPQYAGNIKIGVTSVNVIDPKFYTNIPANISSIPGDYWYISGNEVRMKNRVISSSFCPSLDWLGIGDRIGIRRGPDGTIRIIINSEDMGPVFTNVPEGVFVMIELYGRTSSIHVTSARTPQPPLNTAMSLSMSPLTSLKLHDSLELVLDPPSHQYQPGGRQDSCTLASVAADATDAESISETVDRYEFYENHGRNIEILPNRVTARRVASYNQGVIIVAKPLIKGQMLEVKIEQVNEKWTSSLMVGVVCMPPSRINFPITALGFKKHCWIICSDWLSINGTKIKSNYGSILEHVSVGSRIGLILSETGRLSLCVDGVRLGPLPASLPLMAVYHAVFDLYGQCEQISILNNLVDNMDMLESKHSTAMLSNQFEECCEQPPASTSVDKVDNQQYEKADLESHEKESNIVLEQNDVEADSNLISSSDNDYADIIDGENLNLDNNPALINSMTTSFQAMTLSIHANYSKKCEYLKECVKFKKSLVLPEEFFAPEDPMCYCNNCYQSNSSDMFLQKGESPEENTLPFGYAKFVLNCSTSTTAMTEKWHVAYYGTKLNLIRPILDRGQPLTKEQLQWSNLISQPIEKGESSSSQIEFSPHLQYATLNSKHSYIDNCTKNKIEVSTAFQILVRPGSYSVRQVLDTPLSTEPNGANQTVQQSDKTSSCTNSLHEWYTKETGAIILNSLLIKLDCF